MIWGAAMQVLSATAQVLLLQTVITTNGLKSIPAQVHFQPGIQQDHVFDAGKHLCGCAFGYAPCSRPESGSPSKAGGLQGGSR